MDRNKITYSYTERVVLWGLALFGLVGVNGAFLYGIFYQPAAMGEALANPISAAFLLEAFVLMGVLAYLFSKWRVSQLAWPWFVILSLLGSMAFAIPLVLLFPGRPIDRDQP